MIHLEDITDLEVSASSGRGEEFFQVTGLLSDFISGLELPSEKHNRLAYLILDIVHAAESGAFQAGFAVAAKLLDQGEAAEEAREERLELKAMFQRCAE